MPLKTRPFDIGLWDCLPHPQAGNWSHEKGPSIVRWTVFQKPLPEGRRGKVWIGDGTRL